MKQTYSTDLREKIIYLCAILLAAMAISTYAHGQTIGSSIPIVNDTINLCSTGNNQVNFTVNGPVGGNTYVWNFNEGDPASASGVGPHSISFNLSTVVTVIEYNSSGNAIGAHSAFVMVGNPVNAVWNPSKTTFCASDPAYNLNGFSPPGGYFVGPGITGNSFDPSDAGIGTHNIMYIASDYGCSDTAYATFTVLDVPQPVLTSNGTSNVFFGQQVYSRCVPASGNFLFSSPTDPSTYTNFILDFGDGTPPVTGTTFPSPYVPHTFPGTGFFTVTLRMVNGIGCGSIDSISVFFGSNPSVGLSIKGNNVKCLPNDSSGISFTFPINNTSGNPNGTVYIVTVNDGTPPVIFNHPPPDSIIHTFFEPSCGYNTVNFQNAFQVSITALTPCQPPSVATVEPIYISDPPTAAFEAPPRICLGQVAFINDQSWGSINALNGCDTNVLLVWEISPSDFNIQSGWTGDRNGSGNASNWLPGSPNLDVLFTKPGTYTVRQYVGNQAGCEVDTIVHQICVDSIPDPDFGFSGDTVCIGTIDTLDFWYLFDLYTLCDTLDLSWSISPPTGASFLGNPTDSNISIEFTQAGLYTVSLLVQSICGSAVQSRQVLILEPPRIDLPQDYVQCGGGVVDFSQSPFNFSLNGDPATSTVNWQILPDTGWTYVGGTDSSSLEPIISFSSLGSYTVIVSASNQCGGTSDTMKLGFSTAPTLRSISDTLLCANGDYSTTLTATGGTTPYDFSWGIVGSGNTNYGPNLSITGIVNSALIWVRVSDNVGCYDSLFFNINVNNIGVNAGPDALVCLGDTVFLNGIVSGGVSPFQYLWTPGYLVSDSTIANPYYIALTVDQDLTFTVTDSLGCVVSDILNIQADTNNPADGGPDFSLCIGNGTYNLNDQGTIGGTWSGPGVTGTTFDPVVTGLGTFTLIYEKANTAGCLFYDTVNVTVLALPQASFSHSGPGCSPLRVYAYDSSSTGVNHGWYVNNVLFSTVQNPIFLFTNTGSTDSTVYIKLIISANSGCQDSLIDSVIVHPQPVGSFNLPSNICETDSIPLNASSSVAGSIFQWFTTSNGVSIYDLNSQTTYVDFPPNQSGFDSTYTIGLAVSANGCTDTVYNSVTISSRPLAIFNLPAAECGPTIINASSISIGNNLAYLWGISSPGSIQGATNNVPTIILPNSTSDSVRYLVTLRISDSITGCFDTTSRWYTVYPKPTAAFIPQTSDTCGPISVSFQNLSTPNQSGMNRSNMSFYWDFGNGQTSTDSVPTAVFSNNGFMDSVFVISLVATNAFGCTDTTTDTLIIRPKPISNFTTVQNVNCAPFVIDSNLINTQVLSYPNDQYYWEVLDVNGIIVSQDTGINAINYVLNNSSDTVWLRLTVSSAFGCATDTSMQMFYTLPLPTAKFGFGQNSGCTPYSVDMLDSSSTGASKWWYVNGILSHTGNNPLFQFINLSATQDSLVTIKLVLTSGSGCSDSTSRVLVIHPRPQASFIIPPVSCASDTIYPISTSIHSPGQPSYLWKSLSNKVRIENATLNSPRVILPNNFSSFDSTYTIRLILTSPDGCIDSVDENVTIKPQPRAAFNMPTSSCAPVNFGPLNLSAGQNLQYTWIVYPAIIIQNATGRNPIFNFPVSTDSILYNIRLIVFDSVSGCVSVDSRIFKTYPAPTADFAISRPDSCGPFTINFENYSTPNIAGENIDDLLFDWDFGNGQTSAIKEPTIIFINKTPNDIVYQIRLIITNSAGCTDTMTKDLTIYPDARATASAFPVTGCAPFVIDTNNFSYVDYVEANSWYQWRIYDQKDSLLASFNRYDSLYYELNDPGDSVYLRMIAFSPFGCNNDTLIIPFYTSGKAPVDFTASAMEGCSPMVVQLSENIGGFLQWQWYLNGTPFSTLQNPVVSLTNTGFTHDSVYTISLVAWDGNGCNDSIAKDIRVYANRQLSWYAQTGCLNQPVQFINTTPFKDSISSWTWNFGDGSTDSTLAPSHVYASAGSFIVTLNATTIHGCEFSFSDTVVNYPNPIADFGFTTNCFGDSACVNQTISFYDSASSSAAAGSIAQWAWDIDADGTLDYTTQNISHVFSIAGSYQVIQIVTSQYGCVDSIVRDIHIYDAPNAAFSFDSLTNCGPVTLPVTNLSTGVIHNYQWEIFSKDKSGNRVIIASINTANPNPLPTFYPRYGKDTTYFVELTVTNCCGTDVMLDSITLKALPISGIIADTAAGCSPLSVNFDLDSLVQGNPDYLILDYGDGSAIDTLYFWSQRSHIFINGSLADTVYTVRLTAVNECADSTAMVNILVKPDSILAAMSVTPTSGCSPLEVVIIDQSVGSDNVTWCPDYNPITGTCNSPLFAGDTVLYTYTTPGKYIIAQFISNPCSVDTAYTEVIVHPTPQALYTFNSNACLGDLVMFTDQTTGDTISSYNWDFGDGFNSTAINPSHIFNEAGKYEVCLQVVSNKGCISSFCDTVEIYPLPIIEFWAADACLNLQPIYFYDSSSTVNSNFISTMWNFGDGNTSVLQNPIHTYAAAGVYQVTLIRTNSNGCLDSAIRSVEIFPLPEADFIASESSGKNCGGPQFYNFTNLSTGAAGYYWDFDYSGQTGANVATSVDASHIYNDPGVYEVMLVATSQYGCSDTIFKTIYIRPNPDAGFVGIPQVGCAPLLVTFADTSVYDFAGPGGIVSRSWSFGDGTRITTADSVVTHLYTEPGFYSVGLLIETDAGCTDSIYLENYIEVLESPIPEFTSTNITSNKVQFQNLSTLTDNGTSYYWDFGDGQFSAERDPIHTYNVDLFERDHIFDVCLIVTNSFGCSDTICKTLELKGYLLYVPNAFAPDRIGIGQASIFLPKGHSLEKYHLFIYDEWGNLVFESIALNEDGSPSEFWTGEHYANGTILPMGSYVWKIEAIFNDGTIWPGKEYNNSIRKSFGTVTIIR